MENKPVDELQKRWFIEGLHPKLRKKMKIVPPSSYTAAYNRAMNLESEQKTKTKKKNSSSDLDDNAPSGEDSSSKKVHTLQKDMIRMMKEFKNMHKETKGNELWCTECKKEGHTKGSCPKDQFCEIFQIMGHSIKECPFNPKTRAPQQVFLTQEASVSGGSGNTSMEGATSGGYRNNQRGQSNNNNGNNNGGTNPLRVGQQARTTVPSGKPEESFEPETMGVTHRLKPPLSTK